mmetsp:Transcript_17667/g.31976  ORF Transcript_17667/g.31976 Transcript_17667/m.31976 type:complete len:228 (+) Transcript_17667:71-754(+)
MSDPTPEPEQGAAPAAASADAPAAASESAAPAASSAGSKKEKAASSGAAAPAQSDVSQIDFRVGEIKAAERHPESEKLIIEQIDLGEEGGPRTICSGIAKYFSPEEIVGRRVVVVANLKERKLAGVPSNGMLLCAKADVPEGEEAALEIVEAPAGAAVGERVVIEDAESGPHGEAANANQVQKKKMYEKVAPHLCTNEQGEVCYKTFVFNTSGGPCTATKVPKGIVS